MVLNSGVTVARAVRRGGNLRAAPDQAVVEGIGEKLKSEKNKVKVGEWVPTPALGTAGTHEHLLNIKYTPGGSLRDDTSGRLSGTCVCTVCSSVEEFQNLVSGREGHAPDSLSKFGWTNFPQIVCVLTKPR